MFRRKDTAGWLCTPLEVIAPQDELCTLRELITAPAASVAPNGSRDTVTGTFACHAPILYLRDLGLSRIRR